MLGNGRLEAQCIDGTKRLCHIRGKMRKKVWVNTVRVFVCYIPWLHASVECTQSLRIRDFQGDIILVGLRDYQDEKADVILK